MREINYQLVNIKRRSAPEALARPHLFSDAWLSGPWIAAFIAVLLVGVISYFFKDSAEGEFNYRVLIYTVVGALLLSSGVNVLSLRFLLHKQSLLPPAAIKASLSGGLLATALIAFAAAGAFLSPWDMALSHKIFIILFFVLLTSSLELFIVSSALGYFPILAGAYLALLLFLPGAGLVGKALAGPLGYFVGLALLQVIVFFIQWFLFSRQFGFSFSVRRDLLDEARRDPASLAIGTLLAGGLFADKLVAWIAGSSVLPVFQASFNVNSAFSLAFLFVLPAFVYFFLGVEKGFRRRYREFYEGVRLKATLAELKARQDELKRFTLKSAATALKILLSSVFVFTYFATQVYAILGLDLEDVPLFRLSLWGSALYLLFTGICLLLYFAEWRRAVLLLYALFALLNVLLPVLNTLVVRAHPMYLFPGASLAALLCAVPVSVYYFNNLLAWHFRRPPLGYHFKRVKDDEYWVQLLKEGNSGD